MTKKELSQLSVGEMFDHVIQTVISELHKKYFLVEKTFELSGKSEAQLKKESFVNNIINITCKHFDISVNSIKQGTRERCSKLDYSYPKIRAMIYELSRSLPEEPISLALIGSCVGKDHATVLHAIRSTFPKNIKDRFYKADYEQIKKKVNESLKMY